MTKSVGRHTVLVELTIAQARALSFIARQQFPNGHYSAQLTDGRSLTEVTYAIERDRAEIAIGKLDAAITKRIDKLKQKKGTVTDGKDTL